MDEIFFRSLDSSSFPDGEVATCGDPLFHDDYVDVALTVRFLSHSYAFHPCGVDLQEDPLPFFSTSAVSGTSQYRRQTPTKLRLNHRLVYWLLVSDISSVTFSRAQLLARCDHQHRARDSPFLTGCHQHSF